MRLTDAGFRGRGEVMSNINVTPLVAVMLVLVVNMMLFLPPSRHGMDVRDPLAVNTVDKPDPEYHEMTVVAITADRRWYVNARPVREAELARTVTESVERKQDQTILIKADEDAPYSAVLATMDRLRAAQVENLTLVVAKRESARGKE